MDKLRVGDKVRYQPPHYREDEWENGVVKEVREGCRDAVWVVYNCNEEWHKFENYTGCKTMLADLKLGWKDHG
jgi:hypothetical protein